MIEDRLFNFLYGVIMTISYSFARIEKLLIYCIFCYYFEVMTNFQKYILCLLVIAIIDLIVIICYYIRKDYYSILYIIFFSSIFNNLHV